MDELLSLRDVRTPVRLRFGRRSDERAVPHFFPQEVTYFYKPQNEGKCGAFTSFQVQQFNSEVLISTLGKKSLGIRRQMADGFLPYEI